MQPPYCSGERRGRREAAWQNAPEYAILGWIENPAQRRTPCEKVI